VKLTTRKTTTRTETNTVTETSTTETLDEGSPGAAAGQRALAPASGREGETLWDHLSVFEFTAPEPDGTKVLLYGNGNQQIKLTLVLSPRSVTGSFVSVPASELAAAMTLVNWHTGEPLDDRWTISVAQNEYELANDMSRDAPTSVANADAISVAIYVSTTAVEFQTKVAASIKPPKATQAIDTRPGSAGGGQFDSGVVLFPLRRPTLGIEPVPSGDGLHVSPKLRYEERGMRCTDWFVTLSYGGKAVPLKAWNVHDVPCIWWDNGDWGSWGGFFTLICWQPGKGWSDKGLPRWLGGTREPQYQTNRFYPDPQVTPVAGAVTVTLIGFQENSHFFEWNGVHVPEHRSSYMHVTDVNGNTFVLDMEFAAQRDELLFRLT
jgi:hypothetical protein